jgi:hypothetical protein
MPHGCFFNGASKHIGACHAMADEDPRYIWRRRAMFDVGYFPPNTPPTQQPR